MAILREENFGAQDVVRNIVAVRVDMVTTREALLMLAGRKPRWWQFRERRAYRTLVGAYQQTLELLQRKLDALCDGIARGTAEWNRALHDAAKAHADRRNALMERQYDMLVQLTKQQSGVS